MELLQKIEDRGYPTDYLLARIHGRRVPLFSNWDSMLYSPDVNEYLMSTYYGEFISLHAGEGIRLRYRKELHWIYHQMNGSLKSIFRPYFVYSELDALLNCIRCKTGKAKSADIDRLLSYSLLEKKIKNALITGADLPSTLKLMETYLSLPGRPGPDLLSLYTAKGLKAAEEGIVTAVYEYILTREIHPIIKQFFTALVNAKNILTLYKHLRWDITANPVCINGGDISESVFYRVSRSQEVAEVIQLIYRVTGLLIKEPVESRIESLLNKYILKRTQFLEREGSGTGFILNYLWRCYIEAVNLSVISYGSRLDKPLIKEEIVHL